MIGKAGENAADFTYVARRNNSLTAGGRTFVLCSIAVLVLAISFGFAVNGAWMVVPFAGLEVLVVYLAFRYVAQRAGDYECITFRDDSIVIESQRGAKTDICEFNRHWVHVTLIKARRGDPGRLILRSHGKEVAFGVHLNAEQREALARRLQEHLKNR